MSDQQRIFSNLIEQAAQTAFGVDHNYSSIRTHDDYKKQVPVRDYEGLKSYFDRIVKGEADVLYPGLPKYLAKTSGTTSGVKYIPITPASLPNHINTASRALMTYANRKGKSRLFDGKVMFISGSPTLTETSGIMTGRLSGIVNHEIPGWLKGNQLPSYPTNCIEDWEEKVDRIVAETHNHDLRLISGIPPWVQMYFERLLKKTGKSTIREVFPNLQVFMYGGVNYEPYRASIESLIGASIDSIELYPASEGFIAYQDQLINEGMLLNTNSGIFFEFVPSDKIWDENPTRLGLDEVELDKDYAVIVNNNAGLWAYNLGDTVRFVNLDPYRVIVSGRIKHFISAFGEHVIQKEVEQSMLHAAQQYNVPIIEYTVAPQVNPSEGLPYHEWFVEFDNNCPVDLKKFAKAIDEELRNQNIYYDDLITGNILKELIIRPIRKGGFREYMQSQGKLGGQNKVPRLTNDRKIAEQLSDLLQVH